MSNNFKGHKFFDGIADLTEYLKTATEGISGDKTFVPYLQSDYAIVIFNDSKAVNSSDYEPVLVQTLDLSVLRNGFTSSMDIWGLQSVNFNASNALTFSYLGVPYLVPTTQRIANNVNNGDIYTSIIHYYYARRFANDGTLKIKLKGDKLPAVMIVNTKSNNIVYALYNCTFSYPTFEASPQNNSIAFYKTTVTYSSYREFLGDNLEKLSTSNSGKFANVGDGVEGSVTEGWAENNSTLGVTKTDVAGQSENEIRQIFELAQQAAKL